MDAGGRATQEQLPRASETGFPSWSLGTSANFLEGIAVAHCFKKHQFTI